MNLMMNLMTRESGGISWLVIPAEAGIQLLTRGLKTGFRLAPE
jgi:hypothetical protein